MKVWKVDLSSENNASMQKSSFFIIYGQEHLNFVF